jgi:hypothetical protein
LQGWDLTTIESMKMRENFRAGENACSPWRVFCWDVRMFS